MLPAADHIACSSSRCIRRTGRTPCCHVELCCSSAWLDRFQWRFVPQSLLKDSEGPQRATSTHETLWNALFCFHISDRMMRMPATTTSPRWTLWTDATLPRFAKLPKWRWKIDVSRTWLAVNELPEPVHRHSTWQRERLWEADGSGVKHEATRRAMGNEELTVRFLIMDHTGCSCLRQLWTIKHWHQVTPIWLEVLTGNTDDSAWITTLHIVKGSCLPNLDLPGWHSQGRRKHQQELVAALANQPTKDAVYIWASHASDIPKKWTTRSMKTRSEEPSIHGHHRKLMEI